MRVTFSPEGVDADEVIVDLVDISTPASRWSSRPMTGGFVTRWPGRGANVISVAQLLAVIGRAPGRSAG